VLFGRHGLFHELIQTDSHDRRLHGETVALMAPLSVHGRCGGRYSTGVFAALGCGGVLANLVDVGGTRATRSRVCEFSLQVELHDVSSESDDR